MRRAAELKLHGIDVGKLRVHLEGHPEIHDWFLSPGKRLEILKAAKAIPEGFTDRAAERALDESSLAAFQLIDESVSPTGKRTARLFADSAIVEKLPDGREVRVSGLKSIKNMSDEEYDKYELHAAKRTRQQGRSLNAQRMWRNRKQGVRNWRQKNLPFPEFENGEED